MAHGENLSTSSDNPESDDNKQDGKKKRAVRVPLGLTPQQAPEAQPVEAPKVPARLFDILEQQQAERAQTQQAEADATASEKPEKKKKKRKKKAAETKQAVPVESEEAADTAEPAPEDVAEAADAPELADTEQAEVDTAEPKATVEAGVPAETESVATEKEPLVAEGAVEIPLSGHAEEEVALSERVAAWNNAAQQSPPRAPMSEVGQPLSEETAAAEAPEIPAVDEEAQPRIAITPAHVQEAMPAPSQWRQQLEQQAQAEIDAAVPRPVPPRTHAVPTTPSGPSMPAVPPEIIASQAPSTVRQPEVIERTVVRESSDFWPGVVVGAGVEHIRHKRREKRMEQVQDTQQEQIRQLEDEQARTTLERELAERQELRDAADAAQRERAVNPLESPLVAQLPLSSEQSPLAPMPPAAEAPKQPEQAPAPEPQEATPQIPDRHIETSSWHAIEVDNRTGHAVEQPNIEYGQAFHQEQQPERLPQQPSDAGAPADASGIPTLPQPTQPTPPASTDPRMMGVQTDASQSSQQPTPAAPPQPQPTKNAIIQSGADAALWGGLVIVVIAIVIALSL